MERSDPDVPGEVLAAMSFAQSLALDYAARGGDLSELFGAYVGLVATRDGATASVCLKALDDGSRGGAARENA